MLVLCFGCKRSIYICPPKGGILPVIHMTVCGVFVTWTETTFSVFKCCELTEYRQNSPCPVSYGRVEASI